MIGVKWKIFESNFRMTDFKNLKIPAHTHEMLVSRAKSLGMKYYVLADALILAGLEEPNEIVQRHVVSAQQPTQPTTDTTKE
jgi:hypothetical protein